jgi:hypothetical protein
MQGDRTQSGIGDRRDIPVTSRESLNLERDLAISALGTRAARWRGRACTSNLGKGACFCRLAQRRPWFDDKGRCREIMGLLSKNNRLLSADGRSKKVVVQ